MFAGFEDEPAAEGETAQYNAETDESARKTL